MGDQDDFFGQAPEAVPPMNAHSLAVRQWVLSVFWAAQAQQERSLQKAVGPSEIGTECERQLAMKYAGVEPSNHRDSGWAAWLGTQGHAGMERIMNWWTGATGAYLVERKVFVDSDAVPSGHSDLIDRVMHQIVDWKFLGYHSLKKFRLAGQPSEQYKAQLHTYGYAAKRAGERIDHVCLVAFPRESSDLNSDLWVWSEPYSLEKALKAIKRAERIRKQVRGGRGLYDFPTADDCRYCDFRLGANTIDPSRGCPGHGRP